MFSHSILFSLILFYSVYWFCFVPDHDTTFCIILYYSVLLCIMINCFSSIIVLLWLCITIIILYHFVPFSIIMYHFQSFCITPFINTLFFCIIIIILFCIIQYHLHYPLLSCNNIYYSVLFRIMISASWYIILYHSVLFYNV